MKLILINNLFPHYRKEIWENLRLNFNIEFAYGYNNSKILQSSNNIDIRLKNIYFKKILFWQSGVLRIVLNNNYDIYIFNGESNILSTWIATIILRILRKKVIFWGHGFYGNENIFKFIFRLIFYKLPNAHLLYSEYSKTILSKYYNTNKLFVIYNSINYTQSLKLRNSISRNSNLNKKYKLLFIGRLEKSKKINLLIYALAKLNLDNYLLTIIGDGPEEKSLKNLVLELSLQHNVIFKNAIYNEFSLSKYFFNSHLLVSPGNVGLNVIHSFQYGVPVCTHNNIKNQMPEYESITEYKNGILFKENNIDDLAFKIDIFLKYYYNYTFTSNYCFKIIDKYYNPLFQNLIFSNCIKNL
jgi:glycosyltransferase involved in cell wall biosynthesis